MDLRAEENTVIGLVYNLFDSEGNLIEERTKSDPLFYIHGVGQLLPGVERAIDGQGVGFKATIEIPAAEAYGEYDEDLVTEVERSAFPETIELEVGMQFNTQGPEGESLVVEVVEISDEAVVIDGNHPLAGCDLKFELEVHSIRNATAEEIEHGHVHGKDGSHLH